MIMDAKQAYFIAHVHQNAVVDVNQNAHQNAVVDANQNVHQNAAKMIVM